MKKKIVLLALSSLSTIGTATALVVGSHSNQNIYAGENQGVQERKVYINKNTIAIKDCYISDSQSPRRDYAFSPLVNNSNFAVLDDASFRNGEYAGDYLYSNVCPSEDKYIGCVMELRIVIHTENYRVPQYYRDKAKTQQIYCPEISNLKSIEVTFGENSCYFPSASDYKTADVQIEGRKYTITGNYYLYEDWGFQIFCFYNNAETKGKPVIIDEIAITYDC